uniref:Ribosome biogenesis protein n=1 Tax=Steinernema glaseri TaxID=37863 RepID=A0A1I7YRM5_9BILA
MAAKKKQRIALSSREKARNPQRKEKSVQKCRILGRSFSDEIGHKGENINAEEEKNKRRLRGSNPHWSTGSLEASPLDHTDRSHVASANEKPVVPALCYGANVQSGENNYPQRNLKAL